MNEWNVIYIDQSNRTHPPTSPNTAPATKIWEKTAKCAADPSIVLRLPRKVTMQLHQINAWKAMYIAQSSLWDAKHNGTTTFMFDGRSTWNVIYSTLHGATGLTLQHHQILPPPRKVTFLSMKENGWNVIYYARPIRAWSDHEPVSPQPARSRRFPVELSGGSLYWKTNHLYQLTNKN